MGRIGIVSELQNGPSFLVTQQHSFLKIYFPFGYRQYTPYQNTQYIIPDMFIYKSPITYYLVITKLISENLPVFNDPFHSTGQYDNFFTFGFLQKTQIYQSLQNSGKYGTHPNTSNFRTFHLLFGVHYGVGVSTRFRNSHNSQTVCRWPFNLNKTIKYKNF